MRKARFVAGCCFAGVIGALCPATARPTRGTPHFLHASHWCEEVPGPGDPDGRGFGWSRSTEAGEDLLQAVRRRIERRCGAHTRGRSRSCRAGRKNLKQRDVSGRLRGDPTLAAAIAPTRRTTTSTSKHAVPDVRCVDSCAELRHRHAKSEGAGQLRPG